MFGTSYDRWVTEGARHKCACGSVWTDSDGGPCHETCFACESLVDTDDGVVSHNGETYCMDCQPVPCEYCEEKVTPRDMKRGLCPECHKYFLQGEVVRAYDNGSPLYKHFEED